MAHATRLNYRSGGTSTATDPSPGPSARDAHRRDILEDLLRRTVISRLCLAHHGDAPHGPPPTPGRMGPDSDQAVTLTEILRHDSQGKVDRAVDWLVESGCSIETLLIDLIPAIEGRLHTASLEEGGDHADVTLALWRLQELTERLNLREEQVAAPRNDRQVLLATAEPARFRLRLLIAAEMLDHDGWDVSVTPESALVALPDLLCDDPITLMVLSCEATSPETLATTIRHCRRQAANPDLRVLVMSAALAARPDRMMRVGADAAAPDLRGARRQAGRLLALLPPPA